MKPIPSVLSSPWAIEPQWLRVVYGVWSRGKIDAPALAQAKADWQARQAQPKAAAAGVEVEGTGGTLRIVGSVGVISVSGALFRHADMFTDISGGTTYDALARGIEAALASPAVKSILLHCSSPGGEADGVNDLGKLVARATGIKTTWSFADNMCASACYWLASQTSRIVAEETTEIGSIGVRCAILDTSAADAAMGMREIEIVSSVSPGKRGTPVDDEVVGRLQTRIDDLASIFVDAVARGRGVSADVVVSDFGQGDVMIAAKALDAGLIDEVGDFHSTIAALQSATLTSAPAPAARAQTNGARLMARTKTTPVLAANDPAEEDRGNASAADPMRCAKCASDMSGKAAYCATCYDGEEEDPEGDDEAKALAAAGLLGKTRAETRSALARFALSAIEATGAKSAAAALARATANQTAAAAYEELRAKTEVDAAAARAAAFGDKLTAAIKGRRVTLGMVAGEVPILLGAAKAGAREALAKVAAQDSAAIVAALTSVPITADAMESLDEWLAAKSPVALPSAGGEPAPTSRNYSIVRDASAKATKGVAVDVEGNPTVTKKATSYSIADMQASADGRSTTI